MKFAISDDEPVITSTYVVDQFLPILFVVHDFDEEAETGGAWQFHCGNGDYSVDKLRLVKLSTIIGIDASVVSVADLPIGFRARRDSATAPWIYESE